MNASPTIDYLKPFRDLLPQLREHGVSDVILTFEGEADSGDLDRISILPAERDFSQTQIDAPLADYEQTETGAWKQRSTIVSQPMGIALAGAAHRFRSLATEVGIMADFDLDDGGTATVTLDLDERDPTASIEVVFRTHVEVFSRQASLPILSNGSHDENNRVANALRTVAGDVQTVLAEAHAHRNVLAYFDLFLPPDDPAGCVLTLQGHVGADDPDAFDIARLNVLKEPLYDVMYEFMAREGFLNIRCDRRVGDLVFDLKADACTLFCSASDTHYSHEARLVESLLLQEPEQESELSL